MTDKELAKRLAELCDAFKEMCQARDCEGCEMEAFDHEGVCCHAWIWKRLRAETCGKQDGCPAAQKEDAVMAAHLAEKAKLPKWCKVGQWVLINDTLCKIAEVNGDTYYPFTVKDVRGVCMFAHPRVMWPVRFRPYTYEEAKGLLGKAMERANPNGAKSMDIIGEIVDFQGVIHINECVFDFLRRMDATIDGVPIGVPEIDEEALKEVE